MAPERRAEVVDMRRVEYDSRGKPYIMANTGHGKKKGKVFGVVVKCAKCDNFTWVQKCRVNGRNVCNNHRTIIKPRTKAPEGLDYVTYLRSLAQSKEGPKTQ